MMILVIEYIICNVTVSMYLEHLNKKSQLRSLIQVKKANNQSNCQNEI